MAETISLNLIQCEFESHRPYHPIYDVKTYKVYGPYIRRDLRRHVVVYDGKTRKTVSYSKFIMECFLKRPLTNLEGVHHKNGNALDDRIENYEVMNKIAHRKLQIKSITFICPECNVIFHLSGKELSDFKSNKRKNLDMKGPYCSRTCAGRASHY